ncbi:hypothetical protein [Pectinatus haikarae]|uniref:Helix-turn-helix domain-containing protein n=1 Tax=Pectinatus haikarae TaxID=349096 RepID=A0ABT9Y8Q3_9FIRM|nr:hypothetical protein [Pectinatus haikarae]MDQ0204101.1 hypothetical protein [Pectinatus haikarae]
MVIIAQKEDDNMQKAMSALQYAEHCGLPYDLVKHYCKQGIIPCFRQGHRFCIRPEVADKALSEYEHSKPVQPTKKNFKLSTEPFDFDAELRRA